MKFCYKLFFIFLLATAFSGCTNFMNGGIFKDEFDKAVEIANANEVSVEINLRNKNSGTISPNGLQKFKKGVPFEIELTVKPGFYFGEKDGGTFSVFEKDGAKTTKFENPDEVVKFTLEGNPYDGGGGFWSYIYKVTILKDVKSILINPDIRNNNVTTAPKIHAIDIKNRYEQSNYVDYFTVDLTVEDESQIIETVEVVFFDKDDQLFVTELENESKSSLNYVANVDDIGNGRYHLYFDIDLRDQGPAIANEAIFKIQATVKNEGELSSAIKSNKELIKYPYSNTQVKVFNRLNGWLPGMGYYPPFEANDFMNTEEGIANHSKTVRLIVLEYDDKGRDKTVEGQRMTIRYGFTQDQNQLEKLPTDHTIPFYTAYDLESEYNDIQKILSETESKLYPSISEEQVYDIVDEVMRNAGIQNETYRQWIYYNALCIYPNPVQVSKDEEEFLTTLGDEAFFKKMDADDALKESMDIDYEQEMEKRDKELNNNFLKHFSNGQDNCSVIDLSLPSRFDPYKDFYVKVETDNGINGKKYEVFTFPATPKVVYTQIENNELTYKLYSQNFSDRPNIYRYVYDELEDRCKWESWSGKEDTFTIPEEFAENNKDYSFYLYSSKYQETYYVANKMECYFYKDSIGTIKHTVKNKTDSLEPFPANIMPGIKSNGLNSGTHTFSMAMDKNTLNKFDQVFVKYSDTLIDVSQSADGTISFSIPTALIYNYGNKNESFTYFIVGSKDGKICETEYKISKNDPRIEDNITPMIPSSIYNNDYTGKAERVDCELDCTGSFITLNDRHNGLVTDSEDGLNIDSNNNIEATITFTGTNHTAYNETLRVKFPFDKFLNIPIGHLKNGNYKFDIKIYDKRGNFAGLYEPETAVFYINRNPVSQDYLLVNNGNKISLNLSDSLITKLKQDHREVIKYSIDFFDNSQWKNIDSGIFDSYNLSSQQKDLGKSGLVRLFVNENYKDSSFDNTISYPKYFHVPESSVSVRDYQLLKNSLRIYSERPFFVHILQSDTDYGKNIDDWENNQQFTHIFPSIPKPTKPNIKKPEEADFVPKEENFSDLNDFFSAFMDWMYEEGPYYEAYMNALHEYSNKMNEYNDTMNAYCHQSFIGSEINPVYETANHSTTPYIYNFPWDKLTKKYAVAIIIWADNKRYMVPIDMSLKD